jgi:2-dehydro-3-deoxy-L-rhamnonate dehydrogenase (NAD+)
VSCGRERLRVDHLGPGRLCAPRASPPSAAKLDVLVASAGITGTNTPVRDYPVEAWRQVIDVNLNGLLYCNQAALPHLERNGYGRIVNIASVAGKEGNPNASAYSTSKAGVIGFTKSLGKEMAKTEIRVNCVLEEPDFR